MARVVAVFDDLLLGSNVLGMLRAAGHEAQLTGAAPTPSPAGAAVLIVDLASPGFDGVALVEGLRAAASWRARARSASTRTSTPTPSARAEAAGFDLVVPALAHGARGPALVERLADA